MACGCFVAGAADRPDRAQGPCAARVRDLWIRLRQVVQTYQKHLFTMQRFAQDLFLAQFGAWDGDGGLADLAARLGYTVADPTKPPPDYNMVRTGGLGLSYDQNGAVLADLEQRLADFDCTNPDWSLVADSLASELDVIEAAAEAWNALYDKLQADWAAYQAGAKF